FYLDAAIVVSGAGAEVGGALGSDVVRVATVGRVLLPPHRRRDDHATARLALEFAEARQVGEGGIQEVARRRREKGEREAPRQRLVADLGRRVVEGQRIDALLLQPLAMQLALARRRGEPTLGERREALGYLESLPAGFL